MKFLGAMEIVPWALTLFPLRERSWGLTVCTIRLEFVKF